MCNCSSSSCGCSTVSGRRGPRGLRGPAGVAGTGAQVLSGDGPPTADPTPVTAYTLYEDTATGGHWWVWTPGTPGSWADTGAPVSGADGTDGLNAFSLTTEATSIPAAGGWMLATVAAGENAWMTPGQVVYIQTAGYFQVLNLVGSTQVGLINLRNNTTGAYASNAVSGPLIVGSEISPGGLQGPAGIPVEFTSGAPDPTVAPTGGASGFYVQSGTGGTYWYYNGITAGPWTDTGISVTGPAGATGATGAAGYSPVTTTGTGAPSGGNNGDIYFRQQNPGLLQVYTKAAGVWTAGITLLANRLLGYSNSNPTPNPSSLAANAGDQWWTQIGTQVTMWVYNGSSWAIAISFSTSGGGGGVGTFQQVSDASPVIGSGRGTGTNIWVMETSIQNKLLEFSTSTYAVTFDTKFQRQKCNITLADVTLNWSAVNSTQDCEWVFELYCAYASQATIAYAAGRWTKNPGISHPVILNPGETAIIHCRSTKGFLNIVCVQQNQTIIS